MAGDKGQTSTTTTSLPSWENTDVQNLVNQTNGQTNADLSSVNLNNILSGMNSNTNNIEGQQVNAAGLAAPISGIAANSWTNPGTAQSFMDPYENTALQSSIGLAQNDLLSPELAQNDRNAAASGALGGDRSQVDKAMTTNQFNQSEENMINQGETNAYNTGLSAFQNQQNTDLAAQQGAAATQLQGIGSNIYGSLAANQSGTSQIQASEAPEQQLLQEEQGIGALPKQGTQQTDTTPNGGSSWLGGLVGAAGATGQLLSGIGALAKGGEVKIKGKKPSANVGVPFEEWYAKGGSVKKKSGKRRKR